jgi:amidase
VAFNSAHSKVAMPWFGQDLLEASAGIPGGDFPAGYTEALRVCRRLSREEGIDHVIRQYKLDAVLAPSGGPAWKTDHVNGDHFPGGSASLPAIAGYPNLTIPAGQVHKLPVGVSLFGMPGAEATLIRAGLAFEDAARAARHPLFRPTVD